MQLNEYQKLAMRTRAPHPYPLSIMITALGLTGEAGEFADEVKKIVGHGHAINRDKIIKELGDILWYVADACEVLGTTLEDVAEANVAKLKARYPQGFRPADSINRKD